MWGGYQSEPSVRQQKDYMHVKGEMTGMRKRDERKKEKVKLQRGGRTHK